MSFTSTVAFTGPVLISSLPQTIAVGFPFNVGADLLVLDTGPTSSPHDPALVLTLGSDYTVTGGGYNSANQMQTGSIVVVSGGANSVQVNDNIVIQRGLSLNQPGSFEATGPLTVALMEQAIDKAETAAQQVNQLLTQALHFENWETASALLLNSARKNNLLGFDANGNVIFIPGSALTAGVLSLAGTASQINVNGGTAAVTGNVTVALNTSPTVSGTFTAGVLNAVNQLQLNSYFAMYQSGFGSTYLLMKNLASGGGFTWYVNNGTNAGGFLSNGTFQAKFPIDISAATAGQIGFPSTQNPSSNANTLDDYQEQSWTPTLNNFTIVNGTGGVTTVGTYTKIGRLVFANCFISGTGNATIACVAATSYIGGLPVNPSTGFSGSWTQGNLAASGGILADLVGLFPTTWSAYTAANQIAVSVVYSA